jgi:hypothetical protein
MEGERNCGFPFLLVPLCSTSLRLSSRYSELITKMGHLTEVAAEISPYYDQRSILLACFNYLKRN